VDYGIVIESGPLREVLSNRQRGEHARADSLDAVGHTRAALITSTIASY